jgi:hypothetical protein
VHPVDYSLEGIIPKALRLSFPTGLPVRSTQTPQQTLVAKQLAGRPPRTRGRAGVVADLTGLARNVDLSAHGLEGPTKHAGEKKDRRKENTKGWSIAHKQDKENDGLLSQIQSPREDTHACGRLSGVTPLSLKSPVKEEATTTSIPLVTHLSGVTAVTRGKCQGLNDGLGKRTAAVEGDEPVG